MPGWPSYQLKFPAPQGRKAKLHLKSAMVSISLNGNKRKPQQGRKKRKIKQTCAAEYVSNALPQHHGLLLLLDRDRDKGKFFTSKRRRESRDKISRAENLVPLHPVPEGEAISLLHDSLETMRWCVLISWLQPIRFLSSHRTACLQ